MVLSKELTGVGYNCGSCSCHVIWACAVAIEVAGVSIGSGAGAKGSVNGVAESEGFTLRVVGGTISVVGTCCCSCRKPVIWYNDGIPFPVWRLLMDVANKLRSEPAVLSTRWSSTKTVVFAELVDGCTGGCSWVFPTQTVGCWSVDALQLCKIGNEAACLLVCWRRLEILLMGGSLHILIRPRIYLHTSSLGI